MAENITYYGLIDEFSTLADPGGVLRRTQKHGGTIDEVFSGELRWVASPLLYEAEHGDISFDFAEISEAEADKIVARIRANAPYEA